MFLSLLFSSASLILCGFSFVFFRAYLRRRTGPERILGEFREEADKLIAEIDAITDRDAALVAERIKTLRALLDDVDRRITVYTRELNREKTQEAAYVELGLKRSVLNVREARPPETDFSFSPEKTEPETALNPPPPKTPESVPGSAGENKAEIQQAPPATLKSSPLSFAEQVEELARAGFSPELIASRLGTTLAEVDLAIALLQRK
jgi:hypothetical protein